MPIACWIRKTIDTYSEYVILMLFHCSNCYTDAPQCYIIGTFPVLSFVSTYNKVIFVDEFLSCVYRIRG